MNHTLTVVDQRGRAYKLEFENGRLVKVDGARPQYMSGHLLIELVSVLASDIARREVGE